MKDRFFTVPGGPRKSIQPPSRAAADTGWRCSSCATTAAIVGQPVDLGERVAQHAVAVGGQIGGGHAVAHAGHARVSAEHLGLARGRDQRGGEYDRGILAGRFEQGFVVAFVGGLVEGDVVHDQPGPGRVQAFDHACVVTARDRRPGQRAQALVVDAHDHHAARGALRAAQREARVDGIAIEPVGGGREVHRQTCSGGDQRDREQPEAPSSE